MNRHKLPGIGVDPMADLLAKDHPKQIIAYGKHHTQEALSGTGLERQPFLPSPVLLLRDSRNLSCGPSRNAAVPEGQCEWIMTDGEGGAVSTHARPL